MAKAMTKIEDAQAHAYSLADEALAKYLVDKGVGKMLLDLAMMRPYLIELANRFKHLKKGETILGYTSMDGEDGFCLGELNRTYRACKYVMDGGNKDRKPTTKKLTDRTQELNPAQKQLTAGTSEPENKTENVSVSPAAVKLESGMTVDIGGVKFRIPETDGGNVAYEMEPRQGGEGYNVTLIGLEAVDGANVPEVCEKDYTEEEVAAMFASSEGEN